nr:hypothetical protein CFP56_52215 [Quercus suber]
MLSRTVLERVLVVRVKTIRLAKCTEQDPCHSQAAVVAAAVLASRSRLRWLHFPIMSKSLLQILAQSVIYDRMLTVLMTRSFDSVVVLVRGTRAISSALQGYVEKSRTRLNTMTTRGTRDKGTETNDDCASQGFGMEQEDKLNDRRSQHVVLVRGTRAISSALQGYVEKSRTRLNTMTTRGTRDKGTETNDDCASQGFGMEQEDKLNDRRSQHGPCCSINLINLGL